MRPSLIRPSRGRFARPDASIRWSNPTAARQIPRMSNRLFVSLAMLTLTMLPSAAPAQTPATQPAENLVAEDIPPIPRELVERVGRYTEFRGAIPLSWHPQRREMLIATRFADTAQIHYVKAPGAARTQLTFFKEPVARGSFQPTKGDSYVFTMDAGGNEFTQLYRFDLASGEWTMLTDGKSKNSPGPWSRDGTWMAYTSTRR